MVAWSKAWSKLILPERRGDGGNREAGQSADPDCLGSNPCSSPVLSQAGDLVLQAASDFPTHHRRSQSVSLRALVEGLISGHEALTTALAHRKCSINPGHRHLCCYYQRYCCHSGYERTSSPTEGLTV